MKIFRYLKKSLAILCAFLVFSGQLPAHSLPSGAAETLEKGVLVTVLGESPDDILISTKAVPFSEGETALDVLNRAAGSVQTEDQGFGPFLTAINGRVPEDGYYWGFFINGRMAGEGVGAYTPKNGDHLLFKLQSTEGFPAETIHATVTVVDADRQHVIPETSVNLTEGATAYDALLQAAAYHNIPVSMSIDSRWMVSIDHIGDRALKDSEYWAGYMNGHYMQTGLAGYMVRACDRLYLMPASFSDGSGAPQEIEEEVRQSNRCAKEEKKENVASEQKDSRSGPLTKEQLEQAIDGAIHYLEENGLDWYGIIAYSNLGRRLPDELVQEALETVKRNKGEFPSITDLEKSILVLTAAGKNAADIEGYDLIGQLANHEQLEEQGTNAVLFALLALDAGGYSVKNGARWTREKLVQTLIERQLDTGAWSYTGEEPSSDLTGLALSALAPYQKKKNVQKAISKAVDWLSSTQSETGGFLESFNGGEASESIAMVITGLTAAGMDPAGADFTKTRGGLLDRLLSYQEENGGFSHLSDDGEANPISTNQALLALVSYQKYLAGEGSVFALASAVSASNKTSGGNDPSELIAGWIVILLFLGILMIFLRKKGGNPFPPGSGR